MGLTKKDIEHLPPNHRTPDHCILCKHIKTRQGCYPVGSCKKYECDTGFYDTCDSWEES
jgi:hypothetical protein